MLADIPASTRFDWRWARRNKFLVSISLLLSVILIWLVSSWLAKLSMPADRVGYINSLGIVFSVLGVALSLVGFGITFEQLSLARDDLEATQKEAERIRVHLATYDAGHEVAKATYALKAAKQHMDVGQLASMSNSYADFSESLLMIRDTVDELPEKILTEIDESVAYIDSLCAKLNKALPLNEKNSSEMRKHALLIRRIEVFMQRKAI